MADQAPSGRSTPPPVGRAPLRLTELRALAEAGQAIVQARMDEDQLYELIYAQTARLVDASSFHLGLFVADDFVIKVWVRQGRRLPGARFAGAANEGIVGWLRQNRQPLLVHDFETEMVLLPARPRYEDENPPRSAIFVPILAGETAIGSLAVQSDLPGTFDEEKLRILFIIANQAGIALVNARLYQVVERRARQLHTVAEVSRKVAAILDLDQLLIQVVQLIHERFGYYHVQVFLTAQGTGRVYFRASTDQKLNNTWRKRKRFVRIGVEGIIGWVAQQGQPLLANDVSQEERYYPDDPRLLPDTRAELAVPLIVEDRVLGVLDVQAREINAFTSEDIFILTTLADQIAVAVEDARLYQAAKDEAAISSALLEVANAVARPYHLPDLASAVARLTPPLAGVDRCTILLWQPDEATFEVLASECQPSHRLIKPVRTGLRVTAQQFPMLDLICQQRRPVTIEDVNDSDLTPPDIVQRYGAQALLGVPLIVQDEVLGALVVDEVNGPHIFSSRQIEMARGVASQLALAIENARLVLQEAERMRLGEELRVAHQIQASFLPAASPALPGYDIAHVWLSAREVAGDFYDFIPLSAQRLGLVIADVSDKGVPAALFMALARILLRVVAADRRSPARALRRVNELLLANSRSDMFITLWYGVLDPLRHELIFANAGHNPPLLLSAADGVIRLLRRHGLLLGVLGLATYTDDCVSLAPGDVLVIYTDGVIDALDESENSFDLARLQDVVRTQRSATAAQIADAIKMAVREFVGSTPQFDDLTFIVVKRLPVEHPGAVSGAAGGAA